MELRITSRHFDLTPDIQEYAEKRILPLQKYYNNILDIQLILTSEKHRKEAELTVLITKKKFVASAESNDFCTSIDKVSHKMERILKEHHDKIRVHRKSPSSES